MTSKWAIPSALDCPLPRNVIRQTPIDPVMRWALYLLLLMSFLLMGVLFLGEYLALHRWETHGQVTTAIIEDAHTVVEHRRNRSDWRCVINYSYATTDRTYIRGKDSGPLEDGCQSEIGKTISVRYLREQPEESIPTSTIATLKRQGVILIISAVGCIGFLIICVRCALFLFSQKEKRLLAWGTPVAGTIYKSCIFRRKGVLYLRIWCRYSSQDGRAHTVRRTFSLFDQILLFNQRDKSCSILKKFQDNTTVLYDPTHPWLAALYPLEIFKINESAPRHQTPIPAKEDAPIS